MRLALILGVNSKIFLASQAFTIVKEFIIDEDQIQACLTLYQHLYDKNNVSVMLKACNNNITIDTFKSINFLFFVF